MDEWARLESVYSRKVIRGSNPLVSALEGGQDGNARVLKTRERKL